LFQGRSVCSGISSNIKLPSRTMANKGYNPLIAIQMALDYENTVARGKNGVSFMCNGKVMQAIVLASLFKHDRIMKMKKVFFSASLKARS
jgi:hypothetical protein